MKPELPMEIHPPEIHQARSSGPVLGEGPFNDASMFSSGMPVSEETLTGSSPSSHSETLNDRPLVQSSPNQMASISLPTEVQEGQIIAPLPSDRRVSPPNSDSKTLDDYPQFPSFPNPNGSFSTRKTLDACSPAASAETPNHLPLSPSVHKSPTLEGSLPSMPTAAENNYSHTFCDSDREVKEDPEPIRLLNGLSYDPSLSSPKQWPSWSSSSSRSSKEAWNSVLTPEELWLTSEDTGIPLKDTFFASGIVPFTVGAGLANLGNTCFINAILQCFTHTVPLIHSLRSCSHSAPCEGGIDGFCVLCALRDHIEHSLTSAGGILSPLKLVDNLNYFSSFFRRYQQEDAHEFMQCVLDKLEICFLDLKEKSKSCEEVDNLVEKIFGGRLISKLRCCNCGHCSDTYEPLIDFSLEIENVDTLPSALESFTKVENIDAKFRCDNCNEEVSMEKQLILDQTPSVAAFHLKRFKTDGTYVEKIDNHVEFPLELDLQPYTSCDQSSNVALKYDLYAIVVHVGFSSTSGHYFCFVRSAPDMWYKLDDSKVTRVLVDSVLSQEAYILFYARQGTPWFSSIMEASRPCLGTNILNTSPKSVLDNVDSLHSTNPTITNFASCDASESREFSKQLSDYSCGVRNEVPEVNDIIDASHGPRQYHSELNQDSVGFNCSGDLTTHAQVPCNERNGTLSSLDKNNCHQLVVDFGENDGFHPLTPPSSPGPDAYSPDTSYRIPRDHLKRETRENCKRPLNKSAEDSQRKEAMRYLSKSVPSGRRSKLLMDALNEPLSEGSSNKRRKKRDSVSCKKSIPPSDRKKSNHGSVMCAVAAGLSR